MRNHGEKGELVRTAYFQDRWYNLLHETRTWGPTPTSEINGVITKIMPARVRPGWTKIHSNSDGPLDRDPEVIATIRWITEEGRSKGFRTPSCFERAMEFGMQEYAPLTLSARRIRPD